MNLTRGRGSKFIYKTLYLGERRFSTKENLVEFVRSSLETVGIPSTTTYMCLPHTHTLTHTRARAHTGIKETRTRARAHVSAPISKLATRYFVCTKVLVVAFERNFSESENVPRVFVSVRVILRENDRPRERERLGVHSA